MSAPQTFRSHFLPKKCSSGRTLRGFSSKKRDNIVLIEVDSDDFGDVIILDVPESFHKKFRKKPKHVISIDDDSDDDCSSRHGACDPNDDASTSDRGSHTSPAHTFRANVDAVPVSEGKTPVKLSKSKRTYSGKSMSRNRYGLSSDYNFMSDSDFSDCEFMGDSFKSFDEQWEKTGFTQSDDSNCGSPVIKTPTSASNKPVYACAEEVIADGSKPLGQQSTLTNCPLNCDIDDALNKVAQKVAERSQFSQMDCSPPEMSGLFKRKRDSIFSNYYCGPVDKSVSSVPDIPAFQSAKKMSEAFGESDSLNSEDDPHLGGITNGLESCGEQLGRKSFILPEDNISFDSEVHDDEPNSSSDQNCIIMDREKRKETEEYKRVMEEEWASRQKELQRQAEEARRLRSRKKAEKMRIMANERRQLQRLEEVRETRRKDEENLNQKDKLRAEIKKELRKLETMCGDMSSLLQCLGIPVSGGRYPSPNEIQAAYKRACLKFHPDRFGQSDLRQQVEAEETFKLISTMKEKFFF